MRSPIGSTVAKSFGPDDQMSAAPCWRRGPDRLKQVDLAPRAHELVAHVLGGRHVDHAVSLALRAEDREVPARRVAELEMHAGAVAAERADDLADEARHARPDPRPAMTDNRGWRSSVNVPPPASMMTRWHFTNLRIGRQGGPVEPIGPGRVLARMRARLRAHPEPRPLSSVGRAQPW